MYIVSHRTTGSHINEYSCANVLVKLKTNHTIVVVK
jgi:hypothetical protein